MNVQEAVKRLAELPGINMNRLTRWDRLKLAWRWYRGKETASVAFRPVSVGHGGFDAVITTNGWEEIYIGVPGAFRVWLKGDGTYRMDVPNEAAERGQV